MPYRHSLSLWAAVGAVLLLLTTRAVAAPMPFYDLDSLVYQSEEVVEVELGERLNLGEEWGRFYPARVLAGHKGMLRPGQNVVVECHVSKLSVEGYQDGVAGRRTFLFLKRARADEPHGPYAKVAAQVELYTLVFNGAKPIEEGRVLDVAQIGNPGPYIVIKPHAATPTTEEFSRTLKKSLGFCASIQKRFDAPEKAQDAEWLVGLLRSRVSVNEEWVNSFPADQIAELALSRLINLHDVGASARVLEMTEKWDRWLPRAFANPPGREFLLKEIAHRQKPLEHRIRLTRFLEECGSFYYSEVRVVEWRTFEHREIEGKEGNARWLSRIAELAVRSADEPRLCAELLTALEEMKPWHDAPEGTPDVSTGPKRRRSWRGSGRAKNIVVWRNGWSRRRNSVPKSVSGKAGGRGGRGAAPGLPHLSGRGCKRGTMKDHAEHRKDALTPPMPGIAQKGDEDQIDAESDDAKSIAPSEGSGLSGDIEPTARPDGKSEWMQDA